MIFRLILLLCLVPMFGFVSLEIKSTEYKVVVSKRSQIRVIGKTNVNKFTCDYTGILGADTLFIKTNEVGRDRLLSKSALEIEVGQFDCGIKQMTKDMKDLLKEKEFPTLMLEVERLQRFGDQVQATVQITIAGESCTYTVKSLVNERAGWSDCKGNLNIDITKFGLEPPTKLLGVVQVKKEISIEFDLKLKIIEV